MKRAFLTALLILLTIPTTPAKAEATSEARHVWVQVQAGASFSDLDDAVPVTRGSVGGQVGWRSGSFGFFGNLDFDRTLRGSHGIDKIRYCQVGPGVDFLTPSGSLRSSLSGGLSILTSEVNGEAIGTRGWYLEVRPVSVRGVFGGHTVEVTPFAIEVTRPLAHESDTIVDNYLKVSYEW